MKAICRLHELAMALPDGRSKVFAFGREYDLDEPVSGTPLRELLGDYISGFEPVTASAPPMRRRGSDPETGATS